MLIDSSLRLRFGSNEENPCIIWIQACTGQLSGKDRKWGKRERDPISFFCFALVTRFPDPPDIKLSAANQEDTLARKDALVYTPSIPLSLFAATTNHPLFPNPSSPLFYLPFEGTNAQTIFFSR